MRICLLEPYDTGSHHAWLKGYARGSRHAVVPLSLKGAFWKWRMHGGAVTLARRYREHGLGGDLILASDMLDLTTFLALTRDLTAATPVALYMHENQLTYPPRPDEKRDLHYGYINYASMLCADHIYFNSRHHLESWFDELPRLLRHFPDYNELQSVAELRARSTVLPLGLDLAALDAHRAERRLDGPPLIIWNHRWEYDKGPGEFFEALYALKERGLAFEVALLGEHFVRVPPEFDEARRRLGSRIVHFGYAPTYADYARWLWKGDIVVSTAQHDFFGAAIVEAIYCGCRPVLPNRLAYPEHLPPDLGDRCLYDGQDELVEMLSHAIGERAGWADGSVGSSLREWVARYDWTEMAGIYDQAFTRLHSARRRPRADQEVVT